MTFQALAIMAMASVVAVGCSATDTATKPAEHKGGKAAEMVTMTDQWVKAAPGGMTGVFGTLTNSGGHEVSVVSATSPAAGRTELHEVVGNPGESSTMRPKEGGFAIPAGGTHVLAPGADHLMLMDLKGPLRAGADVEVTLTFDDGTTLPFTAQVRDFAGAQEKYEPAGSNG